MEVITGPMQPGQMGKFPRELVLESLLVTMLHEMGEYEGTTKAFLAECPAEGFSRKDAIAGVLAGRRGENPFFESIDFETLVARARDLTDNVEQFDETLSEHTAGALYMGAMIMLAHVVRQQTLCPDPAGEDPDMHGPDFPRWFGEQTVKLGQSTVEWALEQRLKNPEDNQ